MPLSNNIRHYYDHHHGRGFTLCGEGVRTRVIDIEWPDCPECADEIRLRWDSDMLVEVRRRTTRQLRAARSKKKQRSA